MGGTFRMALQRSAIVVFTCVLGACMRWQELAPLTPRQSDPLVLDSNQTYRFQLEGGDTLLVHDAHVEGDSVAWNEKVSAGTYWTSQRKTIPVSSIQGASVQRADIGATAKLGLFALLAAAVAAVGGAVAFPRY
jgi:hypothetical protein